MPLHLILECLEMVWTRAEFKSLVSRYSYLDSTPDIHRELISIAVLIDTRGTGEAQGPSAGFRTMNSNILSQVSGGREVRTDCLVVTHRYDLR